VEADEKIRLQNEESEAQERRIKKAEESVAAQATDRLERELATLATKHRTEVDALSATQTNEMFKITVEHNRKFEALKNSHFSEAQSTQTAHKDEVATLKSSHETELASVKDAQKTTVASMKDAYRKEIATLNDNHKKKLASLVSTHKSEVKELDDAHKNELDAVQTAYDGFKAKVASDFKSRVDNEVAVRKKAMASMAASMLMGKDDGTQCETRMRKLDKLKHAIETATLSDEAVLKVSKQGQRQGQRQENDEFSQALMKHSTTATAPKQAARPILSLSRPLVASESTGTPAAPLSAPERAGRPPAAEQRAEQRKPARPTTPRSAGVAKQSTADSRTAPAGQPRSGSVADVRTVAPAAQPLRSASATAGVRGTDVAAAQPRSARAESRPPLVARAH